MEPSIAITVLVVEDEPEVARAVARELRRAGYRVDIARSCRAALRARGPYGLGIFDLELTDGCGLQVARELRERAAVDRVVFFTGCAKEDLLARVTELGPVVQKRKGLAALVRQLGEYFGSTQP